MIKRFLSFMFALVLLIAFVPMVSIASPTGTVVTTATELQTALSSGGYIVLGSDIGSNHTLQVKASSTLDLNGYKLSVISSIGENGIVINLGKTLTVTDSQYSNNASPGKGKLYINGYYTGIQTTGATMIIEKGVVEAIGQWNVGIGGRDIIGYYDGGTVIINGGIVTATGGSPGTFGGAGIGGVGTVGTSGGGNGGTITINGGTVTAKGGSFAAGIGGGGTAGNSSGGNGGTIDINGGTITATGGDYAAGIGGGGGGNGGTLKITGGTVKAIGGSKGYDIGSGRNNSDGGSLEVIGGTLEFVKNSTNVATPSFRSCVIKGAGAGKYVGTYDANGNLMRLIQISATPTASKILVNGRSKSFGAYTINGNNYFKLRDLAYTLNGSGKQFEVTWDSNKNAINLISGKSYTSVGGEMSKGDGTSKIAQTNTSAVYLNSKIVALTAYTINGNNYFKLRDLGQVFDFGVTWDSATSTISIDTTIGNAK